MSSPMRFQKIREINVCHMYFRLYKKTKTYFMFEIVYTANVSGYLSKLFEGTKAVQNSECWLNMFMDFGSVHREI